MDAFRITQFHDPEDFLKATAQRDGSLTNFGVGALLECEVRDGESSSWDSKKKTLVGIYKGTELVCVVFALKRQNKRSSQSTLASPSR